MSSKAGFKIFVVEDDPFYGQFLQYHLSLNPDYDVQLFTSGGDVLAALHESPDLISLDYSLPDMTGSDIFRKIRLLNPDMPVIIVSGQEDVNTAIGLLKDGVYDYIVKDDEAKDRLWHAVMNVRKNSNLKQEIDQLKTQISSNYTLNKTIIGTSPAIIRVQELIQKTLSTNITVSITGETGTGKELVAKAIHYSSARQKGPFIAINVAAIPKELLESELFGHEKGAFTGASVRRIGKFEEANKGTLFLDEIAELDINLQAKLLRALQEREFTRVGGNENIVFDVRLISATQRNLAEEVKKGNFREDLYYRLMGLPISMPPLRERGNDILLLAKKFLDDFCDANDLPHKAIDESARIKLLHYDYPGNVRELKAIVELAAVMNESRELVSGDITFNTLANVGNILENMTLRKYTTSIIQQYLNKHQGDILKVANLLDIGKSTIYRMISEGEVKVQ